METIEGTSRILRLVPFCFLSLLDRQFREMPMVPLGNHFDRIPPLRHLTERTGMTARPPIRLATRETTNKPVKLPPETAIAHPATMGART